MFPLKFFNNFQLQDVMAMDHQAQFAGLQLSSDQATNQPKSRTTKPNVDRITQPSKTVEIQNTSNLVPQNSNHPLIVESAEVKSKTQSPMKNVEQKVTKGLTVRITKLTKPSLVPTSTIPSAVIKVSNRQVAKSPDKFGPNGTQKEGQTGLTVKIGKGSRNKENVTKNVTKTGSLKRSSSPTEDGSNPSPRKKKCRRVPTFQMPYEMFGMLQGQKGTIQTTEIIQPECKVKPEVKNEAQRKLGDSQLIKTPSNQSNAQPKGQNFVPPTVVQNKIQPKDQNNAQPKAKTSKKAMKQCKVEPALKKTKVEDDISNIEPFYKPDESKFLGDMERTYSVIEQSERGHSKSSKLDDRLFKFMNNLDRWGASPDLPPPLFDGFFQLPLEEELGEDLPAGWSDPALFDSLDRATISENLFLYKWLPKCSLKMRKDPYREMLRKLNKKDPKFNIIW